MQDRKNLLPSNGLVEISGALQLPVVAAPDGHAGGRRGGARTLSPVLLFLLAIAIPVIVAAYPLSGESVQRSPLVIFLQWTVIVYTAARLTMLSWHGQPRWMSIVFWCFAYVWLGVAGLAQVISSHNPLQTVVDDDLASRQLLVILLGLVCYDLAGYLVHPRIKRMYRPGHELYILSPRRVAQLCVVAVAVTPIAIVTLGGLHTLFSNRDAVTSNLINSGLYDASLANPNSGVSAGGGNAVGGLILAVAHALPFVALFSLLWIWRSDRASRKKIGLQALFVLLLGGNLILSNPISSARYWFLTVVLAFLFIIPRLQRPTGITAMIAAFIVGSIIVFPYADVFRYSSAPHFEKQGPIELFTNKDDYGAATDIALAIRFADRNGHTDGRQVLGAILFWVPRVLWQDKPPNTAYLIATDIGFPSTNLDSPLWAEGFIDFGWLGVALFLGAFGIVSSHLDHRYIRARRRWSPGAPVPLLLIFVPCMAAYEPIVVRGSLLQAMNHLSVLILFLLIIAHRRMAPVAPDYPALSGPEC